MKSFIKKVTSIIAFTIIVFTMVSCSVDVSGSSSKDKQWNDKVSVSELLEYIQNTDIPENEDALTIKITGLEEIITGSDPAAEGTLQYAIQNGGKKVKIILPDNITTIGSNTFLGCKNLISVEIPPSVTSISDMAFWGCTNLTFIEMPSSITSIGTGVFINCYNLESVIISSSLTSIPSSAFNNCENLKSVIIPSSVTSIKEYAFSNCPKLISVTIPVSVKTIGSDAFDNNYQTSVTYLGTIAQWKSIIGYKNIEIKVTCSDGEYTYSTN